MKKAVITTIFSCKGGVGKSTFTNNLAGVLSLKDKKVLIIDLDLSSGGISTMLNIDVKKDLYDLVSDIKAGKFKDIDDYACNYDENIDVISSLIDPRNVSKIKSNFIDLLIKRCENKYDVILIDTSHILSDINLSVLDKSDDILMVITNDPVDLKNTRNMLKILKETDNKYKVILNNSRDTGKDFFSLYDIKSVINNNIDYIIPSSFFIRDIDKYVIDGDILTMIKKIRNSKKSDIQKFDLIAESLLNERENE